MASIRLKSFGGLIPATEPTLLPDTAATVAHNCVLWDGSLRPMAQWVPIETRETDFEDNVKSIVYDENSDLPVMYYSYDALLVNEQPFSNRTVLGAGPASLVNRYSAGAGTTPKTVAVYPTGIGGSVEYDRAFLSDKPVNRLYGATRVRKIDGKSEEGVLTVLPLQDSREVIYEGDVANIQITVTQLDDETTHVRLYRTISGLDTGESVTNEFDTQWHLIGEIPVGGAAPSGYVVNYVDGGSATTDPLDVYYAGEFFPPAILARYFGLTESGWFVTAGLSGDIAVSERYLHHAWPADNTMAIPDRITSMAVSSDNVYLGTEKRPYIVSVSFGDKATQLSARPYNEYYKCLPNTMWPTPAGAMYSSSKGVVALGREGLVVLTSEIVNPGDPIYTYTIDDKQGQVRVDNTTFGVYDAGFYWGFCQGPPRDDFFVLTSHLYPAEHDEALEFSAVLVQAKTFDPVYEIPDEAITTSASITGGVLRALVKSYTMEDEAITTSATVTGGTLRTLIKSYTMQDEAIDVTVSLESGELRNTVVSTDMEDEAIDVSVSLISGTLE